MGLQTLIFLLQVPAGVDPVQWHSWCPNDVEWHIIAAVIASGAALITFGYSRRIRYLVDKKRLDPLWELAGAIVLTLVCAGLGALAGMAFWHWSGGLLAGIAGSAGSPFVVYVLFKLVGRFFPNGKSVVVTTETEGEAEKTAPPE